jgi:hypothetical protein
VRGVEVEGEGVAAHDGFAEYLNEYAGCGRCNRNVSSNTNGNRGDNKAAQPA